MSAEPNETTVAFRRWLPESAAQATMSAHRIIRVQGPDAAELLQGQLSNDINALEENVAQLASYNSPKGRVLAFLRVLRHGGEYWLVVDEAIADAFLQRLKMFVLRAKVTIETADELAGGVLIGPRTPQAMAEAGWPLPETGTGAMHADSIVFALPGPVPRFEIYGRAGALPGFEVAQASDDDLARWDILFRLPRINDANREQHVAQHLDLDELGAINFKKGCYTGQEIIARMKYLGKVKKRTRIFSGSGARPGDAIRSEGDRSVGDVVNVAGEENQQLILATVNLDSADQPVFVNGGKLTPLT